MKMDVHKTLCPFYSTKKRPILRQQLKMLFIGSNSQVYNDNLPVSPPADARFAPACGRPCFLVRHFHFSQASGDDVVATAAV